MNLPNYQELEYSLNSYSPAQAHGLLCAMYGVNAQTKCTDWIQRLAEELPNTALPIKPLHDLFQVTQQQLCSTDMEFMPYLPQQADCSQQLQALVAWSEGFIYGFYTQQNRRALDELEQEALDDLLAISQADLEYAPEAETEEHLAILMEHIKVSVLILQSADENERNS